MNGNRTGAVEASDAIAKLTVVRRETQLGDPRAAILPVNETAKRGFTMKTKGGASPAEKGSPSGHKPNLKERAVHQLREFLAISTYLWVLFAMFVLNQSVVLAREHLIIKLTVLQS